MNSTRDITLAVLLASSSLLSRRVGPNELFEWALMSRGSRREARIDEAEDAIVMFSRWIPGASCIPRAATLAAFASAKGYKVNVVMGLNRERLGGHAWVEIDGASHLVDDPAEFREVRRW